MGGGAVERDFDAEVGAQLEHGCRGLMHPTSRRDVQRGLARSFVHYGVEAHHPFFHCGGGGFALRCGSGGSGGSGRRREGEDSGPREYCGGGVAVVPKGNGKGRAALRVLRQKERKK